MSKDDAIRKVGYIGLGIMGAPMAKNLLNAGFEMVVYNRTRAKAQPLEEAGATVADSPADVAKQGAQVILLNVTDTPDVEEVLFGEDGVADGAGEGTIVIDNSTIKPVATQAFAQRLAEQGVTLLDAPVSGGDVGAQKGTLTIMVGGDEDTFKRCEPIFNAIGKSITYLGPSGMGQTCKACNQIAVSLNLLGACEALALARQSGLNLEKMTQVVSTGAGGSWQLENLGPKIVAGDLDPGFMIDLVLKDLGIISDTARELKLPLNATNLAEGYFRSVQANGGGKLGTQAISQAVERLGGFRYAEGE